jgi:flagellar capping protein FliD
MDGLNLDGISSGLPTSDIIDQLMQFERIPLYSYNEDLNELEVEKGAWRDVNSRISNLESSLSALKLSSTFNSNTTSSSDGDVATATAASEAVAGKYNVTVNNLATTHRVASDMQTDATSALGHSGDIEINGLDTVKFISKKTDKLIEETLMEAREYLPKLKKGVNETSNLMKERKHELAGNKFLLALEGFEWYTGVLDNVSSLIDNEELKQLIQDKLDQFNVLISKALVLH